MAQEANIQKTILEYLEYKRIFHWRQNSGAMPIQAVGGRRFVRFGKVGAPDIFVLKGGVLHGLEVKTNIGKQNENQKQYQTDFTLAGGKYFVVRCLDDVIKIGL